MINVMIDGQQLAAFVGGMKLDADRRRHVLVLLPRVLGVALSCHLASRRLV